MKIMDNALVSAAVLSNRYISDRFLPDKAIDLMDEAAAKSRLGVMRDSQEAIDKKQEIHQAELDPPEP